MFKGSKPTLISFILPILKPDYVANRIVAAIRQGEEVVMIPWSLNFLKLLKQLVSTNTYDWINWICGAGE